MKTLKSFTTSIVLGTLLVIGLVAGALAADNIAVGGPTIQKGNVVQAVVANAALSSCMSIAPGRATYVDLTASGSSVKWNAHHTVTASSPGTAEVVKRMWKKQGGAVNTAYIPTSGEDDLKIDRQTAGVRFTRYSGATTIEVCADQNRN